MSEPLSDNQFELQVFQTIARLEQAGDAEAAGLLDQVYSKLQHTQYWYGTRHKRLWHWAHEELTEPLRKRYFSIVANGTAEATEPPTYAQQFNMMQHRMERAEAELAKLRGQGVANG